MFLQSVGLFGIKYIPGVYKLMRRERLSINLANELKKYIVENDPKKLPSEREIASMFGVTRTVVREALRILEYEGIITTIPGKGSFVQNTENISMEYNFPFKVNVHDKNFFRDLLEVRRALEESAVKLSIRNATDSQLKRLVEISEELLKAFKEGKNTAEIDYLFHETLFLLSGNSLLKYLHSVMRDMMDLLWRSPLGNVKFGDRGIPFHVELAKKMYERDIDGAVEMLNRIIDIDLEDLNSSKGG